MCIVLEYAAPGSDQENPKGRWVCEDCGWTHEGSLYGPKRHREVELKRHGKSSRGKYRILWADAYREAPTVKSEQPEPAHPKMKKKQGKKKQGKVQSAKQAPMTLHMPPVKLSAVVKEEGESEEGSPANTKAGPCKSIECGDISVGHMAVAVKDEEEASPPSGKVKNASSLRMSIAAGCSDAQVEAVGERVKRARGSSSSGDGIGLAMVKIDGGEGRVGEGEDDAGGAGVCDTGVNEVAIPEEHGEGEVEHQREVKKSRGVGLRIYQSTCPAQVKVLLDCNLLRLTYSFITNKMDDAKEALNTLKAMVAVCKTWKDFGTKRMHWSVITKSLLPLHHHSDDVTARQALLKHGKAIAANKLDPNWTQGYLLEIEVLDRWRGDALYANSGPLTAVVCEGTYTCLRIEGNKDKEVTKPFCAHDRDPRNSTFRNLQHYFRWSTGLSLRVFVVDRETGKKAQLYSTQGIQRTFENPSQ